MASPVESLSNPAKLPLVGFSHAGQKHLAVAEHRRGQSVRWLWRRRPLRRGNQPPRQQAQQQPIRSRRLNMDMPPNPPEAASCRCFHGATLESFHHDWGSISEGVGQILSVRWKKLTFGAIRAYPQPVVAREVHRLCRLSTSPLMPLLSCDILTRFIRRCGATTCRGSPGLPRINLDAFCQHVDKKNRQTVTDWSIIDLIPPGRYLSHPSGYSVETVSPAIKHRDQLRSLGLSGTVE